MLCPFCDQELSLFSVHHNKKPIHLCEVCGILFKVKASNKSIKGGTKNVHDRHNHYRNNVSLWPVGSINA